METKFITVLFKFTNTRDVQMHTLLIQDVFNLIII